MLEAVLVFYTVDNWHKEGADGQTPANRFQNLIAEATANHMTEGRATTKYLCDAIRYVMR